MKLVFELNDEESHDIENLKLKIGLIDNAALLDNALTLLSWAVEQRQAGRIVASMDTINKTYRELQMTILDYAADLSKKQT